MATNHKSNDKIIDLIKGSVGNYRGALTLADVSAKSGLSLHEAKTPLNELVFEYRGSLSATSSGELLYAFPHGFNKPWEVKEKSEELWRGIKKAVLGGLKFIVRAWISIVMVAYVVIFALILIAMTFGKNSDRDDSPSLGSSLMMHALLRLVMDSLFWTFHPFSPFYVRHDDFYDNYRRRQAPKVPFYERVNRFFFGPEDPPKDPEATAKVVLQEIRAQRGRVGVFDIMRVTGMSKEEADPFMARLMVDYEGDVIVSDEGGIYFEFPQIRKSALNERAVSAPPIWNHVETVPPFTGNPAGSNMLILMLNGFNLVMSLVAITQGWTLEMLQYRFLIAPQGGSEFPPPPDGVPLLLGYVPFFFSLALFLIPVARAVLWPKKVREVVAKNGKRGLFKAILNKLRPGGIKETELAQAWEQQAKVKPSPRELTREVIKLGGEMEINDENVPVYRFVTLEAELNALEKARAKAGMDEVKVGEVVFSSAR
jgi:hypothetical protein